MTTVERIILKNQNRILLALSELVGKESGQYEAILDRVEITDNFIKESDDDTYKAKFFY